MAKEYTVVDDTTKREVTFEWEGPGDPTEDDIAQVFAAAGGEKSSGTPTFEELDKPRIDREKKAATDMSHFSESGNFVPGAGEDRLVSSGTAMTGFTDPQAAEFAKKVTSPIVRAPIEAVGSAAFLTAGLMHNEENKDELFKFYERTRDFTSKMAPDADASFVEKFLDGAIGLVPYLATGGAGAVGILANAASRGGDAVKKGVDPRTATALAFKDLAMSAAMVSGAIPFGAKGSYVAGAAKGAGINVGLDIADKLFEKGILSAAEYKDLAKDIEVLNPESLGQAAAMGVGFGVHGTSSNIWRRRIDKLTSDFEAEQAQTESVPAERRLTMDLRKEYDRLIANEEHDKAFDLIYKDKLTGVYNQNGWERIKEDANTDPNVQVASSDMSGLKYINDKYGHDAGNQVIKAYAEAVAKNGGEGVFRSGKGDELMTIKESDAATLSSAMEKAKEELKNKEFTFKDINTGEEVKVKGVDFDYATGLTDKEADEALYRKRTSLEEGGQRNKERGGKPFSLVEESGKKGTTTAKGAVEGEPQAKPTEAKQAPKVEEPAATYTGKNLRPAILSGGKVVEGEEGGTHDQIGVEGTRGFVDPEGTFLSRDDAYDWAKRNQPDVAKRIELRDDGKMHSQEYAAAVRGEVKSVKPVEVVKDQTLEEALADFPSEEELLAEQDAISQAETPKDKVQAAGLLYEDSANGKTMFTDPATGSSFILADEKLTPEGIKSAVDENRKQWFKDKPAEERTALDVINEERVNSGKSPIAVRLEEETPTEHRKFIEPKAWEEGRVEKPAEEISKELTDIQNEMQKLREKLGSLSEEESEDTIYDAMDRLEEKASMLKKSRGFFDVLKSERGAIGDLSPVPAFYSQLERVVETKMPKKAEAYVLRRILENPQNGVKKDEMKRLGLEEWLADKKGQVTREEVLDLIRQNQVQVKEVTKKTTTKEEQDKVQALSEKVDALQQEVINKITSEGLSRDEAKKLWNSSGYNKLAEELNELRSDYRDTSKFSQYTTPGGENYRELLFTLPSSRDVSKQNEQFKNVEKELEPLNEQYRTGRITIDELNSLSDDIVKKHGISPDDYENYVSTGALPGQTGEYKSSHWEEPNVLAHVRFNDRVDSKGKKTLFVEEVQSDWAQEGRRKGFKESKREITEGELNRLQELQTEWNRTHKLPNNLYEELQQLKRLDEESKSGVAPSMPFSKTWHELVMKRMLRYAAENGYDKVAWTTGEMQAERYDLSKQVDGIKVLKDDQGTYHIEGLRKAQTEFEPIALGVSADKLSDYIGKDLASKVISANKNEIEFHGLDLKVGGEGMKGFYDKILVDFMNKYTKKWGGKVEESEVKTGDNPSFGDIARQLYGTDHPTMEQLSYIDSHHAELVKKYGQLYNKVHSISLTPAMKSDVLYKGQTLFSFPAGVVSQLGELKKAVFDPVAAFWSRPPQSTSAKDIVGRYSADTQAYSHRLHKFVTTFNKEFDSPRQRAMSRFLEAGGNLDKLKKWEEGTKDEKLKKVYQDAQNLTDTEKKMVDQIRTVFDELWESAKNEGILSDEAWIENYFAHLGIEKPNDITNRFRGLVNSGVLAEKPSFAKQRLFDTLYDLEQAGYRQRKGADEVGFGVTAWMQSFAEAKAARQAVKTMFKATMPDGRPLLYVGGAGVNLSPKEAATTPESVLIKANAKKEDAFDYRPVNHPALRKWKWLGKDTGGNSVLMEGSALVHPKAYDQINALLGKSWFQTYTVPSDYPIIGGTRPFAAALRAGAFVKGTILIGPFHQTTVAEHAVFHGVNPFTAPALNLDGKLERQLMEHGLMVFNRNALHEFGEGTAGGGLLHWVGAKVKQAGRENLPKGHPLRKVTDNADWMQSYGEYLFQDYIPRLKMAMAKAAYGRAMKWYAKDVESGKITRKQILENVAKQANAAFGEINYKYIGRNPTMQDALRLTMLAPDFLEARMKFVGQALRPYGREQQLALVKGAVLMAAVAQTLNVMFGDKKEANWSKPFTVTIGGTDYGPRSVQGDLIHFVTDPKNFFYRRLNPLWTKPAVDFWTGRDSRGRKLSLDEQFKNLGKSWVPIPAQGAFKHDASESRLKSMMDSVLQTMGITTYKSYSKAERMLNEMRSNDQPVGGYSAEDKDKMQKKQSIKDRFEKGELESVAAAIREANKQGVVLSKDDIKGMEMLTIRDELGAQYQREHLTKRRSVPDMLKVWDVMTDEEKKNYRPIILKKIQHTKSLTRDEKMNAYRKVTPKKGPGSKYTPRTFGEES